MLVYLRVYGTINSNSSIEPFQIPESIGLIGLIGDEMESKFYCQGSGNFMDWTWLNQLVEKPINQLVFHEDGMGWFFMPQLEPRWTITSNH